MKSIIIFLLAFLISCSVKHETTEIFVSSLGNDNNSGSIQSPFATAERARDEARELIKQNKQVTVYFKKGVYRFSKPFVLTHNDSGQKGKEITYTAYQNEKVVISGSRQIYPEWKKYNDKIFVSTAKMAVEHGFSPRTLYVNGNACPLARYPNLDSGERPFGGVSPNCINPKRVAGWESPKGAYVHGMQHGKWGSIHYRIIGVTDNGYPHLELVSINTSTMYNNAQLHKNDRYIENVFEELDAPGEWFWDEATELLYFYPQENIDINKARFEIPVTSGLIRFNGDMKSPVRHIKFSNIEFEKTLSTWYLTTEHLPVGDYVIHRGAAVFMEGTENCEIADCSFEDIGSNAVLLSNYNRNSSVKGNRLENIQANGIVLIGSRDAMRDSPWCDMLDTNSTKDLRKKYGYELTYKVWSEPLRDRQPSTDTIPGPKTENYPRYCLVENNLITRAGELEKQVAGILLSMCAENTINHNTIYDLPRAGICINDGCWGGNVVENNDVFHTVLSTADHGPFNSWGRDRHWTMAMHGVVKKGHENAHDRSKLDTYIPNIIRHNRFTHTIPSHSWGIDLDDGSSNYKIYNNLTIGCSVKLREGFFRTVENNIFIGKFPPGKHVCFDNTEDVMRRNIYVNTNNNQVFSAIHAKPSQVKEMDSNLYYITSGEPAIVFLQGQVEKGYTPKMTILQWQEKGHDVNSVVVDPLFVNLESGNYELNKNSPAFKLGFKEFDLDNFGVSKPGFIDEAKAAYKQFAPPLKLKSETGEDGKRYKWMGATIKSMTTEGEKSVAGIDDIQGVILENVPRGSKLFKQGAQSGDVVLKANGKEIKDISDLKSILQKNTSTLNLWVDGNPPAHTLTINAPDNIDELTN
ncbi:MAG: PDZ domain-containing protein [Bacteroidota bacterium]